MVKYTRTLKSLQKNKSFLASLPSDLDMIGAIDWALSCEDLDEYDVISELFTYVPKECNAALVSAIYEHHPHTELLRRILTHCWMMDAKDLLTQLDDQIEDIFVAADFPTDHLPQRLTVYRGGQGEADQVANHWCWTTDRDQAAWFAFRRRDDDAIIVRRDIQRSDILAEMTGYGESEIVLAPAGSYEIEPTDRSDLIAATLRTKERNANKVYGASMQLIAA